MQLQPGAIYRQGRRPRYKACRRGVPGDPSLTYPLLSVDGPLPLPSDCSQSGRMTSRRRMGRALDLLHSPDGPAGIEGAQRRAI